MLQFLCQMVLMLSDATLSKRSVCMGPEQQLPNVKSSCIAPLRA